MSISINCVITKEKELMKIAGNQKRDQEVVPGPFIYYHAHKKRKVLKTKMKLDFLKIFDNFKIFLFKKVSWKHWLFFGHVLKLNIDLGLVSGSHFHLYFSVILFNINFINWPNFNTVRPSVIFKMLYKQFLFLWQFLWYHNFLDLSSISCSYKLNNVSQRKKVGTPSRQLFRFSAHGYVAIVSVLFWTFFSIKYTAKTSFFISLEHKILCLNQYLDCCL